MANVKTVEIYGLYCPTSGELRYIGKANNSTARLKSHIRDSRRRKTPVYSWIRSLTKNGLAPKMNVLQITNETEWKAVEIEQIIIHRALGARLLNIAEGGDEPFCSTETRAANGRKNALAIHSSPERKEIWRIKKAMSDSMAWLKKNNRREKYNELVPKMKLAATLRPDIFGSFLTLTEI